MKKSFAYVMAVFSVLLLALVITVGYKAMNIYMDEKNNEQAVIQEVKTIV